MKLAPEDEKATLFNTMGSVLTKLNDNEAAVALYKEQIASGEGDIGFLHFKLAETLHGIEGRDEEAKEHAKKATEVDPTLSRAWALLGQLFPEGSDEAKEAADRGKFLAWVPGFLSRELEWNDTNRTRVDRVANDALPLLSDIQQMSPEEMSAPEVIDLLGAIIYHHYHGPIDDTAARILGDLAVTNKRAADRLVSLIHNHQSVCTIRLAMQGICRAKDERAVDLCRILLPQDGQGFFPMDIAGSLELLDDADAAVPLLIRYLKGREGESEEEEESDSDDFMMSMGQSMNTDRSLWCLGHYASKSKQAKEFLEKMLTGKESLRQVTAASLYRATRDISFVKENIFGAERVDGSSISRLKDLNDDSEELRNLIETYERVEQEKKEAARLREELGVENWQPTEEQIAKWNEKKQVNMGGCLAREVPVDLPSKVPDITELDFRNNRLKTIPTEVISQWPNLVKINFQANRLAGPIPEGALVHPKVEDLGFHGNDITELNPDIGRMVSLKKLHVTHNSLTCVPQSLSLLTNLEDLSLDNNSELASLPDLSTLTNLHNFSISNCNFHELPSFVSKLPKITDININDNNITFLPDLRCKLNWLRAGKNKLQSLPYFLYANASHVYVSDNEFKEVEETSEEVETFSLVEQALRKAYEEKTDASQLPEDLRSDLRSPSFCDYCSGPFFRYHVKATIIAEQKNYDGITKIPLTARFCQHHPEAITAVKQPSKK